MKKTCLPLFDPSKNFSINSIKSFNFLDKVKIAHFLQAVPFFLIFVEVPILLLGFVHFWLLKRLDNFRTLRLNILLK